jgi:hypothetical protein
MAILYDPSRDPRLTRLHHLDDVHESPVVDSTVSPMVVTTVLPTAKRRYDAIHMNTDEHSKSSQIAILTVRQKAKRRYGGLSTYDDVLQYWTQCNIVLTGEYELNWSELTEAKTHCDPMRITHLKAVQKRILQRLGSVESMLQGCCITLGLEKNPTFESPTSI